MTDWLNPKTSNTHTDELAAIRGRDESNARMNYDGDINIPNGTIRWSDAAQRFEKWNATTLSWSELTSKYMINVDQLDGYNAEDLLGAGDDADTLDGYHAGNAAGQIPINNSVLNVNLNADMLDSRHAGNASNQIAVNNGILCTNLNADMLDSRHAGNASNQIAVNNGILCTYLNADMLDGRHIGSSGDAVPVLNGNNTWSGVNNFSNSTYVGGNRILTTADQILQIFESAEQSAFIPNGMLIVAHGLGVRPRFAFARLRCVSAELGYNVGDETDPAYDDGIENLSAMPVRADATNLSVVFGDYRLRVVNQALSANADWVRINPDCWRLILRAIK